MHGETVFLTLNALLIVSGVVLILAAMLRRQKLIELSHIERMAMIERGMTPPADTSHTQAYAHARAYYRGDTRSRMLSGGIVIIAFGLGLMLLIGVAGEAPESAIGIGGAIAVVGVAFVVIAMVQGSQPPPPPPTAHPPVVPPMSSFTPRDRDM